MISNPDDIKICIHPLPGTIKAFARRLKSGRVCIVINASLDKEAQQQALRHELEHVKRNDFDRDEPVKSIELF